MNIIIRSFLFACLLMAAGCNRQSGEHHHGDHDQTENSPNQVLYDEVMAIHDEVMPKMDDLYKAKTALRTRLETPGLSETEKKEITDKIARIDAAQEGMMAWMRQFNPIPDSIGEEKARAYLETELVKVKKVKEDILAALRANSPAN